MASVHIECADCDYWSDGVCSNKVARGDNRNCFERVDPIEFNGSHQTVDGDAEWAVDAMIAESVR